QSPNLIVTPALFRTVPATDYGFDGVFLRLRPGASAVAVTRAAQKLAKQYPATGGQVFVSRESDQVAAIEHAIRPQAVALAIFALLAALAGAFIVGQV